jgi:hypothetical protein
MKENSIDRVLIFGNVSIAGAAKWILDNGTLTKCALLLAVLLSLLRVVDWCVRRYRYGWPRSENTEIIEKE